LLREVFAEVVTKSDDGASRFNQTPQGAAAPDFELLDAVFSELDRVVREHGMFKYQHVGCVTSQ
jgi:hypothetical protein